MKPMYLGRVGDVLGVVSSPGVHAKPVLLMNGGASALQTLLFGFNPWDAIDRSLIGRCLLTTPPFVGSLCRPVKHTEPVTPMVFLAVGHVSPFA